jgi:hypothetical protein
MKPRSTKMTGSANRKKARKPPAKAASTIYWDAELCYARQLLAEIQPLAAVRRAHHLAEGAT